jgi:uncharacterized protein YicC (UPF0701 family)
VQERVARGRLELAVTLQLRRAASVEVEINETLLEALASALERAREKGVVTGALQPGDLLRVPQAISIREKAAVPGDAVPPEVRQAIEGTVGAALEELEAMRTREDITEEIVRLRGHVSHWRALSDAPEPCGRKLDFLLQEMNREVNTIGSKAEGDEAPALIVEMKAELEKMREQVQNVE